MYKYIAGYTVVFILTLNKPLKLNTSILKKFVLGYVGIFFPSK